MKLIKSLFLPRPWLAWVLLVLVALPIVVFSDSLYVSAVISFLDSDSLAFSVGDVRLSAYIITKALFLIILLFWFSSIALSFIQEKVSSIQYLSGSSKALINKALQFAVYFLLVLFSLKVIGIDLTALAFLGGAVGIGIGFGLQKITSNYISGIILLLEKTIEGDDLVELDDGTIGFIKNINARYTLIETLNGKEILVPNEDFIINKVVNWTYSNKKGRVDIPVGVSYNSDIALVRDILLQSASEHPRCMSEPEPECYLREYGDSSVNFLLVFWVSDVTQSRFRVQSDVMFSIWAKFKEHDIVIPFPQRDLHIIQNSGLNKGEQE